MSVDLTGQRFAPQLAFDFTRATAVASARELALIAAHPERFAPDFAHWLAANWHVWREFRKQADAMRARGFRHYSARTIGEYLRHHTALADAGGEWKLNDHRWPDLARLYLEVTPGGETFFETRVPRQSSKRAA